MEDHTCKESKTCICWLLADEPDESCPVHGWGTYPPRCEVCGGFMKLSVNLGKTETYYDSAEFTDDLKRFLKDTFFSTED